MSVGPSKSSPANSTPDSRSIIFRSCKFHQLNIFGPSNYSPAISVNPSEYQLGISTRILNSESQLGISTRNLNSESQLGISTRNINSESQFGISTRNLNSEFQLGISTRNFN